MAWPALAEPTALAGQGQAVITVLPAGNREVPANITLRDIQLKLKNRESTATGLVPLRGGNDDLELVILIDDGSQPTLGQQLSYIGDFIRSLPATAKVAVGYMNHGQAGLTGPLSADHELAIRTLRIPAGLPASSGSPYFCLSDLAKHWPGSDPDARREVLMITSGVDYYEPRFDPTNIYVQSSIKDSVRSGLVIYSIYWRNRGGGPHHDSLGNAGQNYLLQVTEATGGTAYWQGTSNPVSLRPFLNDLSWRLQNQYRLSFDSSLKGNSEIQFMSLKVGGPAAKVYAPQQVYVRRTAGD